MTDRNLDWRKSSFSGGTEGNCVELAWRKSSFSGATDGNCVEIAQEAEGFAVRDSKNPDGPILSFAQKRLSGLPSIVRATAITSTPSSV